MPIPPPLGHDPLVGYRTIPDEPPLAKRPNEDAAILAHSWFVTNLKNCASVISRGSQASDFIHASWLTTRQDVTNALLEYIDTAEREIADIESGRARENEQ